MLQRMLILFAPIVGVFNFLAGIVAFVWLAVNGEHWRYIFQAFGILIVGVWVLSFLLLPTLLLMPFMKWAERKQWRTYALCFISNSFIMCMLGVWCIVIMGYFHDKASKASEIPMLLLGYATTTGVFQFLASKERDNEFTVLSASAATFAAFITFFLMLGDYWALVIPTWLILVIAESHIASSAAATLTASRLPSEGNIH